MPALILGILLVTSASHALVGGTPATQWVRDDLQRLQGTNSLKEGKFPSVVLLKTGCTGTVVGKRHILTAAHCVVEESEGTRVLKPEFAVGKPFLFDTRVEWKDEEEPEKSFSHHTTIARTLVHPSYFYAALNGNIPEQAVDLAVILLHEEIGGRFENGLVDGKLPIAPVSSVPLNVATDEVVKTGYGCESLERRKQYSSSKWRLKYDATDLPEQDRALGREASYEEASYRSIIDDFYWLTRGWFFVEDQILGKPATNCPGDSGGPLFRVIYPGKSLELVAVNSRSRYAADDKFVKIVIDIHTRLDNESALRQDEWLKRALASGPGKIWLEGISFDSIVPRALDFNLQSQISVRTDLVRVASSVVAEVAGVDGVCPLRIQKLKYGDKEATIRGLDSRAAGEERPLVRSVYDFSEASKTTSFKIDWEKVKLPPGVREAPICFVLLYAPERVAAAKN